MRFRIGHGVSSVSHGHPEMGLPSMDFINNNKNINLTCANLCFCQSSVVSSGICARDNFRLDTTPHSEYSHPAALIPRRYRTSLRLHFRHRISSLLIGSTSTSEPRVTHPRISSAIYTTSVTSCRTLNRLASLVFIRDHKTPNLS